jgi:hypothetical protein
MPDTPLPDLPTPDGRFEAVVEQYLREREEGRAPDPQRYLRSFPELAPLLRDFFAGADLFDRVAPDLAPQAQATPATAGDTIRPCPPSCDTASQLASGRLAGQSG